MNPIRFAGCLALIFTIFSIPLSCKKKSEKNTVLVTNTDLKNPVLDMNDLSFIFPKTKSGQIYPYIPVSKSWNQVLRNDQPSTGPIMLKELVYDKILAATGESKNFLPPKLPEIFKPLTNPFSNLSAETKDKDFEYENLVVTAIRLDPCAPSMVFDSARSAYKKDSPYWPKGGGEAFAEKARGAITQAIQSLFKLKNKPAPLCQTQIRLIVQPANTELTEIKESTIHFVYTLNSVNSDSKFSPGRMDKRIVEDIVDLKLLLQSKTTIDTTGLMLQVHPGLRYESQNRNNHRTPGPGASALIEFLQNYLGKYVSPQVMAIIRESKDTSSQTITNVILGGGTTPENGYSPASLVGSAPVNGFIMKSSPNRQNWQIIPAPGSGGSITIGDFKTNLDEVTYPESGIFTKLMQADNPETTHFFSNDCITCHGTSQMLRSTNNKLFAQRNSARYRVPVGVSGFPIGGYLPGSPSVEGGVMLRNFGYSRNRPIIALRTVTETAALVDYFNRDLLQRPNPGKDCSEIEDELWTRMMRDGIKPEFSNGKEYKIELEKLRAILKNTRTAPEDLIFKACKDQIGAKSGHNQSDSNKPAANNPTKKPPQKTKPTKTQPVKTGWNNSNTEFIQGHNRGIPYFKKVTIVNELRYIYQPWLNGEHIIHTGKGCGANVTVFDSKGSEVRRYKKFNQDNSYVFNSQEKYRIKLANGLLSSCQINFGIRYSAEKIESPPIQIQYS